MKKQITFIVAAAFCALSALAQTAYPSKPVKLMVGAGAGGGTDIIARMLAEKMSESLKGTFIVENRPGASNTIAADLTAKATPDGHTLLVATNTGQAIAPHLIKLAFDPIKDLTPIGLVVTVPNVLVVGSNVPANNVKELVTLMKAKPDEFKYASSGVGSTQHIAGEGFDIAAGVKSVHVPYKGLGPALNDLVAGQLQVVFDNLPSSFALIQGQRIRPLVVTAKERLKSLPDVPTYAEVGLPALNNPSWFGLAAPANTPTTILDTLNKAVLQALKDPETIAAIEKQGAIPSPMTRKEFGDLIQRSNEQWGKVVKDIGFTKLN